MKTSPTYVHEYEGPENDIILDTWELCIYDELISLEQGATYEDFAALADRIMKILIPGSVSFYLLNKALHLCQKLNLGKIDILKCVCNAGNGYDWMINGVMLKVRHEDWDYIVRHGVHNGTFRALIDIMWRYRTFGALLSLISKMRIHLEAPEIFNTVKWFTRKENLWHLKHPIVSSNMFTDIYQANNIVSFLLKNGAPYHVISAVVKRAHELFGFIPPCQIDDVWSYTQIKLIDSLKVKLIKSTFKPDTTFIFQ